LWVLTLVPACFSPSPPTGAPCVRDADCPPPQRCEPASLTCQLETSPPSDGNTTDAPTDGPGVDCWAAWTSGTPAFLPVVHQTVLATSEREQDPWLTPDALGLYFVRGDVIMFSTRADRAAPFGMPAVVTELRSEAGETRLSLALGGTYGIFESRRPGGEGGMADLWVTTRQAGEDTFATPTQLGLSSVNDISQQFDPELTEDGLRLYYSSTEFLGLVRKTMVASRDDADQAFGTPIVVPIDLDASVPFSDPALSPDERVMVFATPAAQNGAGNDLHFATRASTTQPFETRGNIAALDSTSGQGDPDVSDDGCTVIFGSERPGGAGSRDLYTAEVVAE
jgi:hypothetical protein